MRNRFLKVLAATIAIFVVLVIGLTVWIRGQLTGSLPKLDGEIAASKVAEPVTIERDRLGIPTIRAANRTDLAFATGFVHAQDRFFQMDLLRRNSAGELAEMVGPAVLECRSRDPRASISRRCPARAEQPEANEDRELLEA